MDAIGIDGCKGGWVVAFADQRGGPIRFEIEDLSAAFWRAARGDALAVIDIPIGLSDASRQCDVLARKLIQKRRSSVFPPPARCALSASSYHDACRLNAGACNGKKLSKQSFAILPRIKAVDDLMSSALQDRVREAHPEVTFATLVGHPLAFRKKSAEGERERIAILRRQGLYFDVDEVREQLGRRKVGRDDIIDAAACLATAYRLSRGEARALPEGDVQRDTKGLRMEMVA